MATKSEAEMFGNVDQNLLAEDLMSAATRRLLLNDPAKRVQPVGPVQVAGYLERQVPTFGGMSLVNISNGVNAKAIEWLVKFWTWLDAWEKFDDLVDDVGAWNTIQNLHALPLRWTGGSVVACWQRLSYAIGMLGQSFERHLALRFGPPPDFSHLDEANFEGRRVIAGLKSFQSGPALVVHNDGVFTDDDFKGLGNIGQGSKSGRVDSIGRFGLGALSFYHFSELPWVISGKFCLFLDPSQEHLARERGNLRRTAALVPLSTCITRYPDQLKPLDGLFGFSCKDGCYNGTLFRFPLRTVAQAQASKLSQTSFSPVDITNTINRFYAYASQSLFFTKGLTEITALRRTADLKSSLVWSVRSSRETIPQVAQNEMDAVKLTLRVQAPHTMNLVPEHWLVTSTQVAKGRFPTRFHSLFSPHRLPTPTLGLAVNLSARGSITNSRLFATLPLPVSTSLPVHINATWILAQDRRSIRYDAPDATGQRPLDTLYNEHLLKELIAPLYVKTLALVLLHHPKLVRQFWPGKAQDGPSRIVATEIHKQMVSTKEAVLLTAQNQPISPTKAIIHLSRKVPLAVRTILTELQIPNYEGENLGGLPLLLRGDGQLVEFQGLGHRKIFASHRSDLENLFGPSVVVSLNISDTAAQGLAKLNLNVGVLDSQGMRDLLAYQGRAITPASTKIVINAEREWYKRLLDFLASPACPVKLEDLANLPLLPAVGRELVVSLNHARSGKVWWRSPFEDRSLTAILLQLDIVEVDVPPGGTQGAEMVDLARILRLFGQLSLSSIQILQKVTQKDWDGFVQFLKLWIQGPYIANLSAAEFQTLTALPLFKGRQGTMELPFVPAGQVLMLPESVELDALARYLPPTNIFAEYSPHLAAIFQKNKNTKKKKLSFQNLLDRLRIPNQLAPDEEASFSALLQLVTTYHVGRYNNQLVPDGNRVLRRPSELFDHRVDLFSTAFEGHQELFIHPNFRGLTDRLVGLGVQREITSERLLECLRAVDRDARQGQEPPVAWTQRARFSSLPSAHLKAIYPSIGEPAATDVVQHLVSLVKNIAPNHHQSSILLSNIRSVYGWLKDNKDVATSLLRPLSKQPLWLNIDSILDNWTWRTADELVFDLTYDVDGRFVARKFLLAHRSLLVAVGAHEYRVASLPTTTTSAANISHSDMIRAGWNDLRQTAQLLDICFQVDGQDIPAHRGMLAAAIPHFKTAFAGSFRESVTFTEGTELPVYRLPGGEAESAFAVQAIVGA
ncbi:hypothetical protein M407DRAFT_10336 [Tulasnella calospora MUT 4182]|uniref:BTB domain-containing protein n=1 Tax=Tulasnella calospora MUT 4182 TaxID=1051891 RepID=A0A0C3LJD7_9AGAM|nr:hypothetical protein M407DRAFT_10336 [Tulasnella calospora MUT 4182]